MALPLPEDYLKGLIFPTKYVKTLEERIEGLPKWAQRHIAELEARLQNALVCGSVGADNVAETSTSTTCLKSSAVSAGGHGEIDETR